MSYQRYENFTLSLRAVDPTTATVEVISSPVGEVLPVKVAVPLALAQITSVAEDVQGGGEPVRSLGSRLFDFLFPGSVLRLYRSALVRLPPDQGLRLRLQTDSPHLAAVPWEYMYDAESGIWPALDPRTPLVRYYALPFLPDELLRPAPVRILTVMAAPTDLVPLSLEEERAHLETALQDLQQAGQVSLQFMEQPATVGRLQARLRQGFDVLHYVGHGTHTGGHGALLLEREDRQGHAVPAEDIAMLLRRSGVRLICLNACLTAAAPGATFSGLGPALVQAEIPAVVAMQYAMPDRSALHFTRSFYAALADGEPVDAALTAARVALRTQLGAGRLDWGYPVLFMRAPDGRLWAEQPGAAAAVCPACGEAVQPWSRYCSRCGAPLDPAEDLERLPACLSCGKVVRPRSHFCPHCGTALAPSATPRQGGVHIGGAARVAGAVAGRDAQVSVTGGSLYQEGKVTPKGEDEPTGGRGRGQERSHGE